MWGRCVLRLRPLVTLFRRVTAAIAEGKRPVPFRTRKLSPPAPMVLHSTGCGRVGHRRTQHPKMPLTTRGQGHFAFETNTNATVFAAFVELNAQASTRAPQSHHSPYGPPSPRPRGANARALAGREQNSDTRLRAPDKRVRVCRAVEPNPTPTNQLLPIEAWRSIVGKLRFCRRARIREARAESSAMS